MSVSIPSNFGGIQARFDVFLPHDSLVLSLLFARDADALLLHVEVAPMLPVLERLSRLSLV